ncbi:MAG: hypothetical protein JW973_13150 [Bacteroidales bacterium]|nr:hypothetical protein [Bacteroidales bacterium]
MKIIKSIFGSLLLLPLYCLDMYQIAAQEISQDKCDSIFMSALRDELLRSMEELEDDEAGKPFFISYSMLNGVMTSSEAVLGALTESTSMDIGDWYLRLMMGSYERNDENFVDPLSVSDAPNRLQIACPVEPDYWSIRKAFWWNTDNVFRSAVKNYKNKLQAIKEFPLDAETDTLPDYTKAKAITISLPGSIITPTRQQTDNLVKNLSAVFRNVDGIHRSAVSVTAISSTVYMVNTEGSAVRMPLNLCVATIRVQVKTGEEEILSDNLRFIAPLITDLPPVDSMKQAALRLGEYLLLLIDADKSREEYNGPVLLFSQASSKAFLSGLFGEETNLIASREPLVYNMKKSMVSRDKIPFESKLDKRIISKDLSVTALPRMKYFDSIYLMGNTRVDGEGIIPPEKIILVQNGILKGLLNNRIPTPKIKASNGHYRIGVRLGGFLFQDAPSVIKITTSVTYNHADLKKQLIDMAKEKGLEYAYILKPLINSADYSPLCYYRFNILTGEEQLVKPLLLTPVSINDLNKRIALSNILFASNTLFGSISQYGGSFRDGIPVSMIVPDALLLEEANLKTSSGSSGYGMPELE